VTDSRSRFTWCALLLVVGLAASALAQPSPMLCGTSANNPLLREEGYTEPVGDLFIVCTGGVPTAPGDVVPAADFTVFFNNTRITSKVTATAASNTLLFTESLLLVDEPNTNLGTQHPILNCGQTGAPDDGPAGPGVCSITSTGDPTATYDGTTGHPNVFQARVEDSVYFSSIKFVGVPVDPPGTGNVRYFRITNLRANATAFTGCSMTTLCTISATVSATLPGNTDPFIGNVQAGTILPGLVTQISNTPNLRTPATVRITEGFPSAWRARNISFVVGDRSTPGNAPNGSYDGGTNYPDDIAQNVPNALYSTEGGLQWQNDSANGPPSPNPPGFYNGTVLDLGNPLDSMALGELNTGINGAGTVNSGTRVSLSFSSIPGGYAVQVPTVIYLHSTSDSTANSGVMVLTNTDTSGAGPYNPVVGTNGASMVSGGLAVYEVLYADVNAIEYANIPCTLTYNGGPYGPEPKTGVSVTVSLAPFYATGSGADQPTPNVQFASPTTVPRFGPGSSAALFPAKGKGGKP
jgi:hypothetical protein